MTTIFNRRYINEENTKTIISINNTPAEKLTMFKYMWTTYNEPSTRDSELEMCIITAQSKFYELGKEMTNFKIMLPTRVKTMNTLVRSIVD